LVLKEYDFWELVDKVVSPSIDSTTLGAHEKEEIKNETVILDSVKDHLISHLYDKNRALI
jgi:hypothetical protein